MHSLLMEFYGDPTLRFPVWNDKSLLSIIQLALELKF